MAEIIDFDARKKEIQFGKERFVQLCEKLVKDATGAGIKEAKLFLTELGHPMRFISLDTAYTKELLAEIVESMPEDATIEFAELVFEKMQDIAFLNVKHMAFKRCIAWYVYNMMRYK